jgi:hypothetical protein
MAQRHALTPNNESARDRSQELADPPVFMDGSA